MTQSKDTPDGGQSHTWLIKDTLGMLREKSYLQELPESLVEVSWIGTMLVILVGQVPPEELSEEGLRDREEVLTLFLDEFLPWMQGMKRLMAWL